ncbi:MAG: VapC toxin family PIN domain ribonuclease, partial [Chloroflexi bacterium]|nr:VapC toxin family PIN domain ribonuclease [Chloroflexota bacterium]
MALILDTGPLYASLDRRDAHHISCRRLIEETDEKLIIPAPVLVEVDYWIHTRLHPGILTVLLDDIIAGAYEIEELQRGDYKRIRGLCDTY